MQQLEPTAIEDWLTTSEVGQLLGLSQPTVRSMCESRALVAVQTHLGWLVEPLSVEMERARREGEKVS